MANTGKYSEIVKLRDKELTVTDDTVAIIFAIQDLTQEIKRMVEK